MKELSLKKHVFNSKPQETYLYRMMKRPEIIFAFIRYKVDVSGHGPFSRI